MDRIPLITNEEEKQKLIAKCRYYQGETEPPRSLPEGYALMWDYEMRWVDWTLNDKQMIDSIVQENNFFRLKSALDDKTPLSLKILLCNRYMHWASIGHTREENLEQFELWYVDFYQKYPINEDK